MTPPEDRCLLRFDGAAVEHGGRTLVGPLSMTLGEPGITAVLGPNGAGKSLTLRLAHGLLRPSMGTVRWNGAEPRQAFVHQRPILLRRSVAANIRFALTRSGCPAAERNARIEEALSQTGLDTLADRSARALSVGQQQRAALARAWALRPAVLFLDEPTASLDPNATRGVENVIQNFSNNGVICIVSTHDLGQARRLADNVLYMQDGLAIEYGAASRFFDDPQSQQARNFLEGTL